MEADFSNNDTKTLSTGTLQVPILFSHFFILTELTSHYTIIIKIIFAAFVYTHINYGPPKHSMADAREIWM